MSLSSVRLERDCHLQCKCICKSHHELSRPLLLAIATVQEHVVLSDGELLSSPRTLGVYDNGFLLLADDREECENQSGRDVARSGLDLLHFHVVRSNDEDERKRNYFLDVLNNQKSKLAELEFSDRLIKEIIYLALQQSSKVAHALRSPDLVFSAVVHEGLVVLQRQYIALTVNRMFAQGPNPSVLVNPQKFSETYSSIDCLEFLPYGETDRGVLIRNRSKNRATHIWFSSFEEQRDFLDLVNGELKLPKRSAEDAQDAPMKASATKILLQNLQQRKQKFRGRGDAITILNLGEGKNLIPDEFTV